LIRILFSYFISLQFTPSWVGVWLSHSLSLQSYHEAVVVVLLNWHSAHQIVLSWCVPEWVTDVILKVL